MSTYLDAVYPAVLIASAVLFLAGAVTMIAIGAHRFLTRVVSGFYVVTAVEAITLIVILVKGGVPIVITVGYLLAAIALLPLLGIARLGAPDADTRAGDTRASDTRAGATRASDTRASGKDPNRPILQPDQIARVDGAAAMIIAVAAAVVAWRLANILGGVA